MTALRFLRASAFALGALSASAARAQATEGFAANAYLGVPKVQSDELKLEGGAAAGFTTARLGLVANAGTRGSDLAQPGREQTESVVFAGGDGWYRFGSDHDLGASLALRGGFAQHTDDATFYAPFASTEEASQTWRVAAGGGGWVRQGERIAVQIDLLGGVQRESYLRTAVTGAGALQDEDRAATTFTYAARIRGRWLARPDVLAIDASTSLEGYDLSRSAALFTYSPGLGFDQQSSVTSAKRVEATARVEVSLLAAQIVGLAPYAYAQLRYQRTSSEGAALAVLVPSAGLGLRSTYF